MMGRQHAASGWVAGLAVAPIFGLSELDEVAPFALVSAGYALFPDLDHPGATASRLVGPVTGFLSYLLRSLSSAVYRETKGPRDERHDGEHRHLTHTVLFAAVLGGLVAFLTAAWPVWSTVAVIALGSALAMAALGNWVVAPMALAVCGWFISAESVDAAVSGTAGWLGVAVAVGCITHCLGDALTLSGCPFLFPLPIAGETWYEIRPPRWMRFRTGGDFERRALFPLFVVLGVVLLPGVWPTLTGLI